MANSNKHYPFWFVPGRGLFSADPEGGVHWLAKENGWPKVDNFYEVDNPNIIRELMETGVPMTLDPDWRPDGE